MFLQGYFIDSVYSSIMRYIMSVVSLSMMLLFIDDHCLDSLIHQGLQNSDVPLPTSLPHVLARKRQ